jgi:hypothetical protein
LQGGDCPKCAYKRVSEIETVWLDEIGINNDAEHRQVTVKLGNKRIIADGFDPKTNTIYEFYGDFWHGNPKIFRTTDINPRVGS